MAQEQTAKPDAFKAVLAAAQSELGRPELAHQSLGRQLTPDETRFAEALMEVYAQGVSGPEAVAAGLAEKAVPAPSSGRTDWTADSVAAELETLNAGLDAAYDENGFGA